MVHKPGVEIESEEWEERGRREREEETVRPSFRRADEALHALEDGDAAAEERVHAAVEERGRVARARVGVGAVVLRALLAERVLERDGHAEREARELEREVRAAAEVEVGELAERALHLEQARDFVVEREDARPAGCGGAAGTGAAGAGGRGRLAR